MPSLKDKISNDLKEAMRNKDAGRVSALRLLKTAVTNTEIGKKTENLPDADIMALIAKQVKQSRESLEAYKKGGREDLAKKEEAEIGIFEGYLPAQMDDAELEKNLKALVAENKLTSKKEFGKAMGLAQKSLKGRADNKRISGILNNLLK